MPTGGYVQWTRVDAPGSDVHIEINEGEFAVPMPAALVNLLVMFGWNAPDDDFRNCWLRAGPPERGKVRSDRRGFFDAANLIILAMTIALGGSLPDVSVSQGSGEPDPRPEPLPDETATAPSGVRDTMIVENSRDEGGSQRRELRAEEDGTLVIEGHDLGSGCPTSGEMD